MMTTSDEIELDNQTTRQSTKGKAHSVLAITRQQDHYITTTDGCKELTAIITRVPINDRDSRAPRSIHA